MKKKRDGDRAKPGVGEKVGKRGGNKRDSRLKDLDARDVQKVRGGARKSGSDPNPSF